MEIQKLEICKKKTNGEEYLKVYYVSSKGKLYSKCLFNNNIEHAVKEQFRYEESKKNESK